MWPNTVRPEDLKIDFFRSGGKGGQNVNKRDTACRLTHIPTGISAECRVHRTQYQNKTEAFKKLAAKLVPIMKAELTKKKEVKEITERIRTYHGVRNTVKDHRTNKEAPLDRVLNGELDLLR